MSKIVLSKADKDFSCSADATISVSKEEGASCRIFSYDDATRAMRTISPVHNSAGAGGLIAANSVKATSASNKAQDRTREAVKASLAKSNEGTFADLVELNGDPCMAALADGAIDHDAAVVAAKTNLASNILKSNDAKSIHSHMVETKRVTAITAEAVACVNALTADALANSNILKASTEGIKATDKPKKIEAVAQRSAKAIGLKGKEKGDVQFVANALPQRTFLQQIAHTLSLFLPLFMGQLAATSMGVADTLMAGAAGTLELSGVAIGSSVFWPSELFVVGMALAIHPLISNLVGSGELDKVALRMQVAAVCTLCCAAIVGFIIMLVPQVYLMFPETDQRMVAIGQGYLIATGLAMPGFALFNVLRAYWEGLGKTLPTLFFGCMALTLNVPLNYIFIFGHLGMPELGGVGCGVATALTIYITSFCMLIYVRKSKHFAHVRIFKKWLKVEKGMYKAFLKLSLPLGVAGMIETLCFSLVAILLSPFGPVIVASHTIAMNVSGMLAIVPIALSSTASIEVGEAMGASSWKQARRRALSSVLIALSFYCIGATFLFTSGDLVASWYSDDSEVLLLAPVLMLYCCVFFFPETLQVMAIGVLRGFKDSRSIFIVTIVAYWLIGMPIGYALGYGHVDIGLDGAEGFWLGFIISLSAAAIMLCMRLLYIFKKRIVPSASNFSQGF